MSRKLTIKMKALRFVKKHKKNTTRHTLLATSVILFLLVMFPVGHFLMVKSEAPPENNQNKFTASFAGDMVFNSYYDKSVEKGRAEKISSYLQGYLATSDYTTGSINGSITDKETELLKDFNFDTVDIYNETQNDIKVLDDKGILYVGSNVAAENKIVYQEMNGIKTATIGTSEGKYVASLQKIKEAKLNANLVVVHVNWKEKYDNHVSDNQRSIAKAISDAGADIILGHGTEVLEPIEIFNGTIIMYSLGNFLHGEMYATTNDGALIQYMIGQDGYSESLRVVPLSLAYGRPQPALGFIDGLNRNNIFKVLTRELPDYVNWTVDNGILNIPLN